MIGRFKVWAEGDLANTMNSRERLMDCRLVSMIIKLNGHSSYRNTVDAVNDFLTRTDQMHLAYKTTSDFLIRLGVGADKMIDDMCSCILEENGFNATTVLPVDVALLPPELLEGNDNHAASIDAMTQERINQFNALESHKNTPITPEIANAEDRESGIYNVCFL